MAGANGNTSGAIAALFIVGTIAYMHFSSASTDKDAPVEAAPSSAAVSTTAVPEPQTPKAPDCANEQECMVSRLTIPAQVACREAIARHARYDVRWEGGMLGEDMFVRAGWSDETKTAITFAGDAVSLQNGFGAFSRVTYFCTVNTLSKAVTGLKVIQGRLPAPASE